MPLTGAAKASYQRQYMRAYRARNGARRTRDRLAAVQHDRDALISQMAEIAVPASRIRPPEPPPILRWRSLTGPSPQSPPCLIHFPPEPLLLGGSFTTHTKWRR